MQDPRQWVGCGACQKWRLLPTVEEAEEAAKDNHWTCAKNSDENFNSCDVPQVKSDREIDEEIKKHLADDEEGSPTAVPASGTDGGDEDDEQPAEARPVIVQKVNRNVFKSRLPKQVNEDDVALCDCKPEPSGLGCGPNCLNRRLLMECSARFCQCGAGCQNQRFRKAEYATLGVMKAGKKGHGLQTLQDLKKGQFIIEYVGEILDEETYTERKKNYFDRGQRHYYFMNLTTSEVIDATSMGNMGRFVNHSCAPNCETQKWTVNGELCIGLFAKEDIKALSELTFDYNFERYGDTPIRCFCGAKECKGWIGGTGENPPEDDEDSAESDYEDEPEPILLASNGTEMEAFKVAEAKAMKAEEAKAMKIAQRRRERMERRQAAAEATAARRRSGASAPSRVQRRAVAKPFVKRTEVDRRMDDIRGADGGLRDKDSAVSLLRLFNLAMQGEAGRKGASSGASQIDLSILLNAIENTKGRSLLQALVDANAPTVFHMAITRLRGDFGFTGVIRKILGVMSRLPLQLAHLEKTHSAAKGGSLLLLLEQLRRSDDQTIETRAKEILDKVLPKPAPMQQRPLAASGANGSRASLGSLAQGTAQAPAGAATPLPGQGPPPPQQGPPGSVPRQPTPGAESAGPRPNAYLPPPPPLHTPPGGPLSTPPPGPPGRGSLPGGPPGSHQSGPPGSLWGPPANAPGPGHGPGHGPVPGPGQGTPQGTPQGGWGYDLRTAHGHGHGPGPGPGLGMNGQPQAGTPPLAHLIHQQQHRQQPPGAGPDRLPLPPPPPVAMGPGGPRGPPGNGATPGPGGYPSEPRGMPFPDQRWGPPDRRGWTSEHRGPYPDDRERDFRDPKRLRLSDGPFDKPPSTGLGPGPQGPPPGYQNGGPLGGDHGRGFHGGPPGRAPDMGFGQHPQHRGPPHGYPPPGPGGPGGGGHHHGNGSFAGPPPQHGGPPHGGPPLRFHEQYNGAHGVPPPGPPPAQLSGPPPGMMPGGRPPPPAMGGPPPPSHQQLVYQPPPPQGNPPPQPQAQAQAGRPPPPQGPPPQAPPPPQPQSKQATPAAKLKKLPDTLPDIRATKAELERLPTNFANPQEASFARAVEVMVTHRVGKYRQREHPNYIAHEAEAVKLVDRITSKVVEKEREHFLEKREPIQKERLQQKITEFVREFVHSLTTAPQQQLR